MRVLFIGNSHTYVNDLPELFRQICDRHGIRAEVTMLARGGIGFEDHAEEPQTRFNILYGHYDYIVYQHRAHPMGNLNAMKSGLKTMLKWTKSAGSTAILYQTWAKKGDESFQEAMSSVYNQLGAELNVKVAPVGTVWQQKRASEPENELYAPDGEHASLQGSLLAAEVIYETIFS